MPAKKEQFKDNKETIIQKNQKDAIMMSMYIVEEYTNLISCQEQLYQYNGKCYDLLSDKDLDSLVQEFAIKYGATKIWEKVTSIIRSLIINKKIKKIEKLNDHNNVICLNNGILDIYTKEFKPHSPEYYFDSCINVDYDPEATQCPNFINYLNHTFNNDTDTIANIIRLGGYLLDTSCAAKKMFIFDGNGGSGKSTLIDTFSMFFVESLDSRNQVTGLTLEELAGGGFDKEILIKSRFNQCSEARKGYIDSEEIKKIVTGDIIKVSRKYSTAVNFRPKLKLIVACNGKMKFTDTSDGIFRRLCIFQFENQYKSPSEIAKIKNPEALHIYPFDMELMDKIRLEKTAILNLFIGGLLDLKNYKYEFVDSLSSWEAIKEFRRDSDTVREFLEDNYEVDVNSNITLEEIFDNFRYWYRRNVQDTQSIKFRTAEMAKRIREVFGVKSNGRRKVFNDIDKRYEVLTVYPLMVKIVTPDDNTDIIDASQSEEATQAALGIYL